MTIRRKVITLQAEITRIVALCIRRGDQERFGEVTAAWEKMQNTRARDAIRVLWAVRDLIATGSAVAALAEKRVEPCECVV